MWGVKNKFGNVIKTKSWDLEFSIKMEIRQTWQRCVDT